MRGQRYSIVALALALGVAGCASTPPPKDEDAFSWTLEPTPPAANGAIYQPGRELALFENTVAHRIGDTVTILLQEQTQAEKSATTTTSKATNVDMAAPTLFGKGVTVHGVPILKNSIDNSSKFDGEGASKQSNSLQGAVMVTVAKVLPNGNLFVHGEKWLTLNQGQEFVRLSGVIRPIDIAPDNTISSAKVASAKISYAGKGALADANKESWLGRFFQAPWAPF
jgi:flagellar L-ring protein precursor FlgH